MLNKRVWPSPRNWFRQLEAVWELSARDGTAFCSSAVSSSTLALSSAKSAFTSCREHRSILPIVAVHSLPGKFFMTIHPFIKKHVAAWQ